MLVDVDARLRGVVHQLHAYLGVGETQRRPRHAAVVLLVLGGGDDQEGVLIRARREYYPHGTVSVQVNVLDEDV